LRKGQRAFAYWVIDNAELKEKIMDDLKTFFRPEFLNRVDEILVFNPLTKDS